MSDIAAGRFMPFPPSSMIIRAEILRALGGFDEELYRVAPVDDLDLVARVAATHLVLTLPESLGSYRVHESAETFTKFYQMQDATRFVQARIGSRKTGEDLDWDQWKTSARSTKFSRKHDLANYLYRRGGLRIANGDWLRGVGSVGFATLLDPRYTLPRFGRQFLFPRARNRKSGIK